MTTKSVGSIMEKTTCPRCGAEVKAESIGRLQRAMEQHYTDAHNWKKE